MLAGGVVQADAFFPGLRLHQDQLRSAGVVLKPGHVFATRLGRHQAIDQQHARELLLKVGDRRRSLEQIRTDQVLEFRLELSDDRVDEIGIAAFRKLGSPLALVHVERIEPAALVVVMEDDHLAAHRHVLSNVWDNLLCLDGFEQIAPRLVIKLVGNDLANISQRGFSVLVVGLFPLILEPLKRLVDALADGRLYKEETPVIVGLDIQDSPGQRPLLLQEGVELSLHQPAVDLGIWLRQLAGTHPVAKVLHEELVAVAALVIAPGLRLV